MSSNQVIRGSGNQEIRKSGTPDHPITRSPDHPITRFPDSKKAGFTVLEAMIALVILSVALFALLRVMPVGLRASKLAEDTTIATMLAQKKIEEVRVGPWPPSAVDSKTNLESEGYPNFEYTIEVTAVVTPTTYLRGLIVSVYWPAGEPAAEQRVIDFATYVADYNPP